ncbi:MAG: hypothetical protein ACRDG4_03595 [Chloroflexota bacterium]
MENLTGRRARLADEQRGDQARAATELQSLVNEGAGDEAIGAAWWSALRLGCALPADSRRAGRAARARDLERRLAALPAYTDIGREAAAPHFPQPPAPSLAQLLAAAEVDQARALAALWTALDLADLHQIARAAETTRTLGAFDPEVPWQRVEDAEAMVNCESELRAALRGDDLAGAASAWFRMRTLWPGALSPEDDAAGRTAFRAWGHSMRRALAAREPR